MRCFLISEGGKIEYASVAQLEAALHQQVPPTDRVPGTKFHVESAVSNSKWVITFTARGALRREKHN